MKRTRAELEAAIQAEAQIEKNKLLDWHEDAEAPTLEEIEDAVLEVRKRIGERVTELMIEEQEAVRPVPGPVCATCEREMHYKGMKTTTIEARVGEVTLERGYYYCKDCRGSLFPPGSAIESEDEKLE